jgi:hypothetical protein
MSNIWTRTRERSKTIFSKKLKQIITLSLILFLCFLHCSFTSDTQRSFIALQFVHTMSQKSLNLAKELGKLLKIVQ